MLENLQKFIAEVQGKVTNYYATNFSNLEVPTIRMGEGKKFWKIFRESRNERSVFAFIDKETGNIFKPARWNAPAKHVRGNINSDQNGLEAVSADGQYIIYLRG